MSSYTHLTSTCRGQVQALINEGKSRAYIAMTLGRHRSTIGRELRRNSASGGYDAAQSQKRYHERRKACRPEKKLNHLPLWKYVFDRIPQGWSPQEIAGRLPIDHHDDVKMRISHEALYQNLYTDERMRSLIADLPQARPKRRKRGQGKTRRGPSIPERVGIEERPQVVNERSRFGDWEGDTVVGANQQAFLVTLVERSSRLSRLRKTLTKQADEVATAVIDALEGMPVSWVKTITFDNGTEFARHTDMAKVLPVSIYFATPYSSYQRGTNENTNGLIRRYLPKRTDLRNITPQRLQWIEDQLNNRPRKVLGYRTPNEVFFNQCPNALVALST